jgi:hypothetical protein
MDTDNQTIAGSSEHLDIATDAEERGLQAAETDSRLAPTTTLSQLSKARSGSLKAALLAAHTHPRMVTVSGCAPASWNIPPIRYSRPAFKSVTLARKICVNPCSSVLFFRSSP